MKFAVWPFRRLKKREAQEGAAAQEVSVDEAEEQRYKPVEWPIVRRVIQNLMPYRRMYLGGLLLGMVMLILEMQSPRFMQFIIDHVTAYATGKLGITASAASWKLVWLVLAWAGVLSVALVLQRYVILIMTSAGERVQFALRRQLFEHLQRLSMSYYDKTKLGRIISRCTSDINSLREVNVWGIWQILANLVMMVVAAGYLLYTDLRLFLSVAWLGPVLYWCNRVYLKKTASMHQQV